MLFRSVGISVLSIVLLGLFLKSNSDKNEVITKNEVLNESIAELKIINVVTKEKDLTQPIAENKDTEIKYVVRKGDYLYKIAKFFYNDGSKYKQIESDNNLEQPYILKVGQVLIIKISQ